MKKTTGLRRLMPFILRFNRHEMGDFQRRAKETGLTRTQYARCVILHIPFDMVGGKKPREVKLEQPVA